MYALLFALYYTVVVYLSSFFQTYRKDTDDVVWRVCVLYDIYCCYSKCRVDTTYIIRVLIIIMNVYEYLKNKIFNLRKKYISMIHKSLCYIDNTKLYIIFVFLVVPIVILVSIKFVVSILSKSIFYEINIGRLTLKCKMFCLVV